MLVVFPLAGVFLPVVLRRVVYLLVVVVLLCLLAESREKSKQGSLF